MRRILVFGFGLLGVVGLGSLGPLTRPAHAQPAPGGDALIAGEQLFRPPIEWSTWLRLGYGVNTHPTRGLLARATTPASPAVALGGTWEGALGIEASLPLSARGTVRLGAWSELRGVATGDAFAGGEVVLTAVPRRLDMFLYEGHGILAIRAGRSTTHATGAIAYGYLAPWKLEGPCANRFFGIYTGVCEPRPPRATRYMVGVRLVATVTRALDDPRAWSATLGIETEPLGALRAIFGLRSWY